METIDSPIFISNNLASLPQELKNPIIFKNSNEFSGFKVLKNNLLIFVGDGKELFSTEDYRLSSHLYSLNSPTELKENLILSYSVGISRFLNWKRKEWKNTDMNTSLESKFSTWEAIN